MEVVKKIRKKEDLYMKYGQGMTISECKEILYEIIMKVRKCTLIQAKNIHNLRQLEVELFEKEVDPVYKRKSKCTCSCVNN
mgnify:CR=1 FL=1